MAGSLHDPPASSLRRALQVAAVLQWVFSFLGLAQVGLALLLLALLGRAWALALLYLLWLFRDRHTPGAGGRRSAWVGDWTVWRHFRDYFPISLVKTAELDLSRNYLLGFHPHRVLMIGAFGNFCTEASGFWRLPGLRPHLLCLLAPSCTHRRPPPLPQRPTRHPTPCTPTRTPGLVSSGKASVAYLLSLPGGGQVVVLAVGGPLEALEANPGALSLRIHNQKGLVKLELEHGASLVPVFSLGENQLFRQVPTPPGSRERRAQEALRELRGVALPLFYGRRGLLLPFRSPVHTVGEPRPLAPRRPRRPACRRRSGGWGLKPRLRAPGDPAGLAPQPGPLAAAPADLWPRGTGRERLSPSLLGRDPNDRPLSPRVGSAVGTPIPVRRTPRPSRAQVAALHALYLQQLTQLFPQRKARYGVPAHRHLVLI
ncbi:2-acylglycerol O-acyltransferase 2-B-like [Dasypus novemcinctus]|uniref:2-acylglycerol O-acyltransferase 2-B-like n=1 Tax=Dasypus novemcinctus TaxID=9361 RepID=UPI0039C9A679